MVDFGRYGIKYLGYAEITRNRNDRKWDFRYKLNIVTINMYPTCAVYVLLFSLKVVYILHACV